MRAILQRVTSCSVTINHQTKSQIGNGLLILLGIEENDTEADIYWLVKKIIQMRIFSDENGKMNWRNRKIFRQKYTNWYIWSRYESANSK